jgi:hypothetical protein
MSTSAITGTGVLTAGARDAPAVAALLQGERVRSLNAESKLLLAAARLALRDAGLPQEAIVPEELGVVVATCRAGHEDYVALLLASADAALPPPSPSRGPQSGMNAPAAIASIRLRAEGPNATLSNGALGGFDALRYASDALAGGRAAAMLGGAVDVVAGDEPSQPTGGAAVLLLEAGTARCVRARRPCALVAGVATAHAPHGDVAEASERACRQALDEAALAGEAPSVDSAPARDGADSVAAVEQLALAAARLGRGEASGPLLLHARDGSGGAAAAVLVERDWRGG